MQIEHVTNAETVIGMNYQKKTELKDHVQTAEHHQILYDKFHVLFKNIQRKIATKFLSTLVL